MLSAFIRTIELDRELCAHGAPRDRARIVTDTSVRGSISFWCRLLDALSERHGSTIAFTRQIHFLLLRHFMIEPLAFFLPVEPYVPPLRGSSAVRSAKDHLAGL